MLRSRIAGLSGWQATGAALLLGAVLGLGQAPFSFPWLLFVGAPVLYLMAEARRGWAGFRLGWWAGLGYFAVTLHWILEPFLVDMARTGWMAPFALFFMAAGLALFWGAGFGLFARFGGGILAFAGFWTLAEFARAMVLTGFPWALISYGFVDTPLAQGAAFLGPHALGFVLIAAACLPVLWRGAGTALLCALLACGWGLGMARQAGDPPLTEIRVRLLQPNAPQHQKWDPAHMPTFWERQLGYTAQASGADLVVWPETAVPFLLGTRPDLREAIAGSTGAQVIFGVPRTEEDRWYNAAAVLAADGRLEAVYDKHHLVPFGEFLPFPDFFETFGLQALAQHAGRFAAGPGPRRLSLPGLPDLQLLICYEAIFPHEILRGDERPDWLLHLTNDAWFGDFSGPYQHLAQARMRAIEFGLPVARSANTGVSAMIGPRGALLSELALNEAGYLDAALPAPLAPTLYARAGDLWFMMAVLILCAAGVARERRRAANG